MKRNSFIYFLEKSFNATQQINVVFVCETENMLYCTLSSTTSEEPHISKHGLMQ